MFRDDLVRRWRRESKANSPRLLRAAGGNLAVLPDPQRTGRARPVWAVVAILALFLLLLFGSGRLGVATNTAEPTQPTSVLTGA